MNLFEKISFAPKKDTLRKESQEILKLEYDKATKFFAMGSATSMGYTTLTLGLFIDGRTGLGLQILIQLLLISWRTLHWNIKTNNIFEVLKKKGHNILYFFTPHVPHPMSSLSQIQLSMEYLSPTEYTATTIRKEIYLSTLSPSQTSRFSSYLET